MGQPKQRDSRADGLAQAKGWPHEMDSPSDGTAHEKGQPTKVSPGHGNRLRQPCNGLAAEMGWPIQRDSPSDGPAQAMGQPFGCTSPMRQNRTIINRSNNTYGYNADGGTAAIFGGKYTEPAEMDWEQVEPMELGPGELQQLQRHGADGAGLGRAPTTPHMHGATEWITQWLQDEGLG